MRERLIKKDLGVGGLKRGGRILLLSDLDKDGEEIFMMYKQRGGVEKQFNTYKNALNADRMYLQDDESILGHLFTSLLALYGYCTLEAAIKEAGLLYKFSSLDLLEEFSKIYISTDGEHEVISEIPRKVEVAELDTLLGLDAFPKIMRIKVINSPLFFGAIHCFIVRYKFKFGSNLSSTSHNALHASQDQDEHKYSLSQKPFHQLKL